MPVALNAHAHDRMQRLLHTADYVREYLAVREGAPGDDEGVCCLPIGHADGVKRCIAPDGKPAVTHYQVLRRAANGRALIRLRLETGRTHQIRVHMQALSSPIAGDWLYGTPLPELPGRFALHSARLAFTHPLTGKDLSLDSPLPEGLFLLCDE
jgi:23S rRNA-/tRNA-specific pseudouridylate synthase